MGKALDVIRALAGETAEQRLIRRAGSLSSEELVLWTENSIAGIGKAFGDWQREGLLDGLQEARVGAASVVVVLEELERRRVLGLL
jgi:hypothetical protein